MLYKSKLQKYCNIHKSNVLATVDSSHSFNLCRGIMKQHTKWSMKRISVYYIFPLGYFQVEAVSPEKKASLILKIYIRPVVIPTYHF